MDTTDDKEKYYDREINLLKAYEEIERLSAELLECKIDRDVAIKEGLRLTILLERAEEHGQACDCAREDLKNEVRFLIQCTIKSACVLQAKDMEIAALEAKLTEEKHLVP